MDVAYLRGCSTSIASVLESLGYDVAENARNFQFEKRIPNSPEVKRIEFMAPAEFARKDGIRVDVQDRVHGRACVGGSIVVVETEQHRLVGSLPDGKPVEARIRVTRPYAMVLLKLLAMDDRYHFSSSGIEAFETALELVDPRSIVLATRLPWGLRHLRADGDWQGCNEG